MQTPDEFKYYSELPLPETIEQPPYDPTPNDPPWGSLAAIGVWFISILAIAVLPVFLIIPYFIASGQSIPEDAASNPTVILLGLASVVPAHLLTLLAAWPVVTSFRKYPFLKTLGWKMGGVRWWVFPLMIAGLMGVMIGISQLFPEQDNDLLRIIRSSPIAAYSLAILATLFAPFVEELVYRGVLYSAFQRSVGNVAAVIIVTLMFAGIHYPQYWGSPGSIIAITLLSLTLTLTRSLTGNLLPCVILHFLFNGLQSIGIVATAMTDKPEPATAMILHLLGK